MTFHIKKYNFIVSFLLAAVIALQPFSAFAAGSGDAFSYADYTLTDGLTYRVSSSYDDSSQRHESFVIENAPGSSVRPIVFSGDTIYGGYRMSDAVSYLTNQGYNVVGGINSDFFNTSYGTPLGIVIENGIIKSGFGWENVLYFREDGTAGVSRKPWISYVIRNTTEGDRLGKEASTANYNKVRSSTGLWLYSEYYSTVSTRTTLEGWMIRFKILSGRLSLGETLELEVSDIYESTKAEKIGKGYLILTAQEAAELGYVTEDFQVGDTATLTIKCYDSELMGAIYACGCGDIIIENGSITASTDWDRSLSSIKAPRTAVGMKADGTTVFYVTDGRSSLSSGSTMKSMAEELLALGCVTAVNLDGGGSSALSLRLTGSEATTVQNTPSDGAQRYCSTYVMLVSDKKSDGRARTLSLSENGAWLLSGSSLKLSVTASDSAMYKAEVPSDVTIAPGNGEMKGNTYVSPSGFSGKVPVRLYSSSAEGSATLWVTDRLSTLSATDSKTGKAVSSVTVKAEAEYSLGYYGTYLKKTVITSPELASWECDEKIGTITQEGVFTASSACGAVGYIRVTAGGQTAAVKVTIPYHFDDMNGHWAADYTQRLYDGGYIAGTSGTTFSPDVSISRGALMCMVYNAAGKPEIEYSECFPDVAEGQWYTDAVIWAKSMGITSGYTDGLFHPADTVTNQQAWTFMINCMGVLGLEAEDNIDTSVLEAFPDHEAVKDYALRGAAFFSSNGGITLGDDGTLSPAQPITRAAVAKLMCHVIWGQ